MVGQCAWGTVLLFRLGWLFMPVWAAGYGPSLDGPCSFWLCHFYDWQSLSHLPGRTLMQNNHVVAVDNSAPASDLVSQKFGKPQ
jgi:hypothetical protein